MEGNTVTPTKQFSQISTTNKHQTEDANGHTKSCSLFHFKSYVKNIAQVKKVLYTTKALG